MVRESDRVEEWHHSSIEDDGDYEIGGGDVRKMVQAVEQRAKRERKEVLTKSGRRMINEMKISNPIDNVNNNEEEDLEEDIEVISLQGNIDEGDNGQDEESLVSSFEFVDPLVDCTHQCNPSHAHHHSRIESHHHSSHSDIPTMDDDHSSSSLLLLSEVDHPSQPQSDISSLRMDCKTQAYWMAVTEQWAAERTRMK